MSDINIIENSIWPTTDGRLGINKVSIPDGVNTFWPEGNALVKNFIYKDDKLVGYIDTKSLIENESKISVLPYEYVDITLDDELKYSMTFEKGENCKYLNIKYESSLPLGYKRLEYLESTGEQYIDSGKILLADTQVRSRFQQTKFKNDAVQRAQWLFGVGKYGASAHLLFGLWEGIAHPTQSGYMLQGEYGGAFQRVADSINIQEPLTLEMSRELATLNAEELYYVTTSEFAIGDEVLSYPIFDGIGSAGALGGRSNLRIWYFVDTTPSEGGLRLSLIPALDPTGAPCMFDIVTREPFYNSGTGDFIYPNVETQATTYSLRNRMYAKMTEHGIHRLYHAPINYSGTKEEYASENGFKQLVELPRPEEGNWIPDWRETDTELICDWIEIEEEIPSEI